MRPDALNGKKVIDSEAQVLGEVAGIEIDIASWTVTHLCINLSDKAIEALGYKKPFLGKVQIDIPVGIVKAVKDVVTLDKSLAEIKTIVEPHRE